MKGTIIRCLQDWVEAEHGRDRWADVAAAVFPDGRARRFPPQAIVAEEDALALFGQTAEVLGMTAQEVFDGFGHWWAHTFAPRVYPDAYRASTFVGFLVQLNEVHRRVTEETHGRPPILELAWREPTRLTVSYRSARGLIGVAAGLLRGHVARFAVDAEVRVQSATRMEIVFAEAQAATPSLVPPSLPSRSPPP